MFIYSITNAYKMLILHAEVLPKSDNLYSYQHKGCHLTLVVLYIILAHLHAHRNPGEAIIAMAVLVLQQQRAWLAGLQGRFGWIQSFISV